MHQTRLAAALALCFAAASAMAERAPIARVTLYAGSATVERSAAVRAGTTELEIEGLPANFDPQTVRVQASPGIRVGQIVTRDVSKEQAVGAQERELEARLQALKDSRDVLNVEIESAELVKSYLTNLKGGSESGASQADGKSMTAMIAAIRQGGREALAQIQRTQVQVREVQRKIAALEQELAKVRSGARAQRSITITLAAPQSGTLRLAYQVDRAGWKPAYRATLDSGSSTIELERMAVVSQHTGEDWSGVELRLSTGQPRLSPDAPEPAPRLLNYQPPARADKVVSYATAPEKVTVTGSALRAAPPAAPAYAPPVLELQGAYDTEFAVPTRVDLAADGREINLALARQSLAARQLVRVVPRQSRVAVLTAEAERPSGVWLSGNVQLFRDGAYVGATHWNTQASDKLRLSFGRDELVRVTVDRAEQQSGSGGFLSQRGEHQVEDLFTISSAHKAPVELLVLEAAPVSNSDEVKVSSQFAPQPGIQDWERRRGVVGWEKRLAPGEAMKIRVGYTIRYPKEGMVSGLPPL